MRWATSSLFIILFLILLLLKRGVHFIDPVWMSVFYFYGLGLPIYIYVSYLMVHFEAVNWASRVDRIWFYIIHIGIICVCSIHVGWTWLALNSPYQGGL
ncbi:MAG: hypothetical protein OXK80_00545 [Bdellovibrionales bacterium]|nr:hypothetical protein [Bdellovibrionales bacterium]